MSPRTITIPVPLPHKLLSPNGRTRSWRAKAAQVRLAKSQGCNAALIAMHDAGMAGGPPKWKRATVRAVFYLRDKRGLEADQDNRQGSLKAHIDGIAASGLIDNDRGLTWLSPPITHAIDKARPRVEIVITETP